MRYFSQPRQKGKNLRPPDLYEHWIDNFWFKSGGVENKTINQPLRGSHEADIVIIGGGYTGLSSAYHLKQHFPQKKIVLLEGAFCGYGASGRNGGFCITTGLLDWNQKVPEQRQKDLRVSSYGINFIKRMIAEHGLACDFQETGLLEMAITNKHVNALEEYRKSLASFGLDSTMLHGKDLETEIRSPLFIAGIKKPFGAILNPAKLARGMKKIVEGQNVEIWERTVVTRVTPGKTNHVDTEFGEIKAPILVIALNAYGHKLGFFKDRVFPVSVFQIATEPLSDDQWASIGWQNRQGLSDMRTMFSYSRPTVDGRIVMGGSDFVYYDSDALHSGSDKAAILRITNNLFETFPQLEGLKIEHTWGGTTAYTLGRKPSVGVMGDDKNIYYATGFNEGVPTTQTAGRIISELIAGEKSEFTDHIIVNQNLPYAGPVYLRGPVSRAIKWMMENWDYSPIHG